MSDDDLVSLTSPQRFWNGNGLSWREYSEALAILDRVWRERRYRNVAFGVLGPQPSWEDTINRGATIFEMECWDEPDSDQASMIAPTHFFADGDALLGL